MGREPGKTFNSPDSQIHQRSGMETQGGEEVKVAVYEGVGESVDVAVGVSVNVNVGEGVQVAEGAKVNVAVFVAVCDAVLVTVGV